MKTTHLVLIALTAFLLSSAPAVADETEHESAPADDGPCALVQVSPWQAPFVSLHPDCLEYP